MFEQADGGTIFLDEIGDMSLKTQSKVLRVLEEGEVQKVGSSRTNKVDVRVITATNKDLHEEIGRGRFREDLFFRLNVVPLVSPPLRERKEDIQILAEYFCRTYADENNARPKRFAEDALEAMMKYPWKGNVRELRNLVERLIIMTDGEVIRRRDLPETVSGERSVLLPDAKAVKTLREYRDLAEKDFILAKLEVNGWNISQTAREIDTPRSNLYKKLEQYGIKITAGVGEAAAPSSEEEGE
jgi:two-component system nitrogen regulation response regulator NtrX